MKKAIVLMSLLGTLCLSAFVGNETAKTSKDEQKVNYLVEGRKECHTFSDIVSVLNGLSSTYCKRYNGIYEFNMNNSKSAEYADMLWGTCFSYSMPKTIDTIVRQHNGEKIGPKTYTSNKFVTGKTLKNKESLQYRLRHDPSIASSEVSIERGYTVSTTVGIGFGVYAEGSWAVSASFEANFGFTFGTSDGYSATKSINLTERNLSAGEYEVFINYYSCNKFFFNFDNSGKLVKVAMYRNCPLPNVDYSVERVGD